MKVAKSARHLGQSLSLPLLFVLVSLGVFALMMIQTRGL